MKQEELDVRIAAHASYLSNTHECPGKYLDLTDRNIVSCNLSKKNLRLARFFGTHASYADFSGSDLSDASFASAILRDTDLSETNITGTYFGYADLQHTRFTDAWFFTDKQQTEKATLIGDRPILLISPIGSRSDCLQIFTTDRGIYLKTGCFFGTIDDFREQLNKRHGDIGQHTAEYTAAMVLARLRMNFGDQ